VSQTDNVPHQAGTSIAGGAYSATTVHLRNSLANILASLPE
jgi:hypothetical protein